MVSAPGIVLIALGLLLAGGSLYLQDEVKRACSTQDAQVGQLIGHPDAQACATYPPALNVVLILGLGAGALGLVMVARR